MRIAIIGGTGFVGRYLTSALLNAGHAVSLLVRPGSEGKLRQASNVYSVAGDLSDDESLRQVMQGCDAVIYSVGILREFPRKGITFESVQYEGLVKTVAAAKSAGVQRLLLMSANGVKVPGTPYQESKYRAERHAIESGLDVTIFRPSVIFGNPHGAMEFATQLYNEMVRPPMPAARFYSGGNPDKGAVVMSPVHIEDVAGAFVAALEDDETIGKTFSLGGPETLTWQQMIERIAAATGRKKWCLPVPIYLVRFAATMLDWLPSFPVTRDQLTMLQEGNVADAEALKSLIGRPPRSFSPENLTYLSD